MYSLLVSPLSAGTGHVAGGTVRGLLQGKSFEEAIQDSFKGIGTSMALGGAIGLASTVAVSYANGINPWTGKELGPYSVYQGVDQLTGETRYVGITRRNPEIRFAEHLKSHSSRSTLYYNVVKTSLNYIDARIYEQTLINRYGLGNLYNKINSISPIYWKEYNIKP